MAGAGESGIQLYARLAKKPSLQGKLEPALFPNGPPHKSVIELYGEEGTGKTQMLIHLLANCILPKQWNGHVIGGLEVSVILVDTDFDLSMIRLMGLLDSRIRKCVGGSQNNGDELAVCHEDMEMLLNESLERLYIVRCKSSSQLFITLDYLDSLLASQPKISVLMIDSISAFYWIDKYAGGDSIEAQELNMTRIAKVLAKLTNTHNLVVFATKNVFYQKAKHDGQQKTHSIPASSASDNMEHCEYLCKAWSKLITQRLIFRKESAQCSSSDKEPRFSVCFDSSSGSTKLHFTIDKTGVIF